MPFDHVENICILNLLNLFAIHRQSESWWGTVSIDPEADVGGDNMLVLLAQALPICTSDMIYELSLHNIPAFVGF